MKKDNQEKEKVFGILYHDKPKSYRSEWDCYGHFNIYLVREDENGKTRNFSSSGWEISGYASLCVSGQYHVKNGEVSEIYGSKIEYREPLSVDLERAELMLKTLKGIHKRMDKIADEWGLAKDFYILTAYFLKAVGAAGWKTSRDRSESSYDRMDFHTGRIPDLGNYIRNELISYQAEIAEKEAV